MHAYEKINPVSVFHKFIHCNGLQFVEFCSGMSYISTQLILWPIYIKPKQLILKIGFPQTGLVSDLQMKIVAWLNEMAPVLLPQ